MGKVCDMIHGLKPTIMMVIMQIALTGVNIFLKLAGNNGMNMQVLIAYRFIFTAATVVPLALIIERKNRPKLTWTIVLQAFVSALFGGSMAQNLYAESSVLTSATFTATITNLIPAVTFILAIFFRMEGLGLRTMAGKAKTMGTFMCIGGAMLFTFYKGCEINIWSNHFDLLHKSQQPGGRVAKANQNLKSSNSMLGLMLALAFCFSMSLSLIVQTKMSETYPCHYSSTALLSIIGSVQAIVFALCIERDWSQWKLGWDLKLLTVAYTGIVASGLMWPFALYCMRMRGPLFVAIFNPLLLVFVTLAGSLLLNEKLHLGSAVVAVIIICGLYSILWGKSKEMKKITHLMPSKSFKDHVTEDEVIVGQSFKDFNHGNNVMTVSPNSAQELEILGVFNEEEDKEKENLEASKVSSPHIKS